MVWPAVAPQLVALLKSPPRQWPVYLISFAAAVLHRDQDWVTGRSDSLRSWQRFLIYGVVLAPLLASPIGIASLVWNGEVATDTRALAFAAMAWCLTESVGIAFLVPLMLRWEHYRQPHTWREVLWFAMMTALTVRLCAGSATKSSFVLVFLTGLPALLVLIRSGIAAAFAEMAVGSALVLGSTFAG